MVRRFNESDTLDWVGKEYKQGIEKYNADTTFKRDGITYFIEFLDPYGSNYLAKWWDNSDNGLGYNNQGFVAVNNPFNRMTGYFSPENIDDYLVLFSDYDRKPPMSIQRIIFDKVKRQLDYGALNDVKRTNESTRRTKRRSLREGDVPLKTNYAVIVYDMNTGSYNLYTGTKKMCEQLYKDLFDFNIDDYDDDEKDDMYDWLYGRLNEFNCIERIDFRRGIDYRNNYSDGYDIYHIINYTKPRHPISLYL